MEYAIDERAGNSYSAWLAMGSPQSPSAREIAALRAAAKLRAVPRELARAGSGVAQLRLLLPRQSVKLVEIEMAPRETARPAR